MAFEHGLGSGGLGARGEYVHAVGGERGEDCDGLLGRLAGGEDDLGKSGAETAVMVDAGVAQVLKGRDASRPAAASGVIEPRSTSPSSRKERRGS